mgnify:CR=1 FL=1
MPEISLISVDHEVISELCKQAKLYFSDNPASLIFEDPGTDTKIVRAINQQGQDTYYLAHRKLGSGSFGEVSAGKKIDIDADNINILEPEEDVAIKITDFSQNGTVGRRDITAKRQIPIEESKILEKINQLQGFAIGKRTKTILHTLDEMEPPLERTVEVEEAVTVMPLFTGHDVEHQAHGDRHSYGSTTFAEFAAKISNQLQALHQANIIHTDLKPANVIWNAIEGFINIIDFNRAKELAHGQEYIQDKSASDPTYMAPECVLGNGYLFSKASDIYSLGKILSEHSNLSEKKYLGYDELIVKRFVDNMMHIDPNQRPSIEECALFFSSLYKKMELDIHQPSNNQRLALSKRLIHLENETNKLRDKILGQSPPNQTNTIKYQEKLNLIQESIVLLSHEEIDIPKYMVLIEKLNQKPQTMFDRQLSVLTNFFLSRSAERPEQGSHPADYSSANSEETITHQALADTSSADNVSPSSREETPEVPSPTDDQSNENENESNKTTLSPMNKQ